MHELVDIKPVVDVQEAEYLRLLGYPVSHRLEGRPKELAQWAREWYGRHGKPWIYARQVDDLVVGAESIRIEQTEFSSKNLIEKFVSAEADGAFVAAVSAGKECEEMARQLWQEEKPDEYFFLEIYGSAVVEHLIAKTGFHFCDWADSQRVAILPHYSPGYPGWDISDQNRLLAVIRKHGSNTLPGELQVLQTGMLNPKKSLLAVFGVTRNLENVQRLSDLVPCENCSLPACQYRRLPYRKSIPRTEDVQKLQSQATAVDESEEPPTPLTRNAKYATSTTALRKWSQERLVLNSKEDGSVDATFRFDGTTCSNLGRPLQFNFSITLGPESCGYPILSVDCVPSSGDEGHKFMCEYLRKGDAFIRTIRDEQPLVGQPLNTILNWERPYSPSGCFCERAGRLHKWGLAFEVLHFALANRIVQPISITSDLKTADQSRIFSSNPKEPQS